MFTYGANPFPSIPHEPLPLPHEFFRKIQKKHLLLAGTEPGTALYNLRTTVNRSNQLAITCCK